MENKSGDQKEQKIVLKRKRIDLWGLEKPSSLSDI